MEAEIKRKWLWTNAKLIRGQRCIIYFIEQTTKQVEYPEYGKYFAKQLRKLKLFVYHFNTQV